MLLYYLCITTVVLLICLLIIHILYIHTYIYLLTIIIIANRIDELLLQNLLISTSGGN